MSVLQLPENGKGLVLKAGAKPLGQLTHTAKPFAGIDRVADPVDPFIGSTEVCEAGQHREMVKPRCAADTDVFILHQQPDKLPVDPAAWIVHDLL